MAATGVVGRSTRLLAAIIQGEAELRSSFKLMTVFQDEVFQ